MRRAIKLFVWAQDVSQFMSRSHAMSNLSAIIKYRVLDVAWIRHIQSQHKYSLACNIPSGLASKFQDVVLVSVYDIIMFDNILKISLVIPENNCSPSWMNMKMKPWMSFYCIQLWTTMWNGFADYIVGVINLDEIHLIFVSYECIQRISKHCVTGWNHLLLLKRGVKQHLHFNRCSINYHCLFFISLAQNPVLLPGIWPQLLLSRISCNTLCLFKHLYYYYSQCFLFYCPLTPTML